ncbi:MAG: AAA family ATPase [Actinomycetota bacterium]
MREATVLLGVDDPGLQDEVLDYLDRLTSVRVVGAVTDADGVERSVRERRPDAVVVTPSIAGAVAPNGTRLLVIERRESTEALRAALRAGAASFHVWPLEREALGEDARSARRHAPESPSASGSVVAVCATRGGAGATFLATNLAAALARLGARTGLIDLDFVHGDVAAVMPLPGEGTVLDLLSVVDELSGDHVERISRAHPSGFGLLAAPEEPSETDPHLVAAMIPAARSRFATTVVHVPRSPVTAIRAAVREADVVLLVSTLDVAAIHGGRRMLDSLATDGVASRARLVMNRATRGEIVPSDAAEALGIPIAAVIPLDRAVERAQNRGQLVIGRSGPAARVVVRLARTLLPEAA